MSRTRRLGHSIAATDHPTLWAVFLWVQDKLSPLQNRPDRLPRLHNAGCSCGPHCGKQSNHPHPTGSIVSLSASPRPGNGLGLRPEYNFLPSPENKLLKKAHEPDSACLVEAAHERHAGDVEARMPHEDATQSTAAGEHRDVVAWQRAAV